MNEYPNLEALADGRVETNARIGDYPLLRSEAQAVLAEVARLRAEADKLASDVLLHKFMSDC